MKGKHGLMVTSGTPTTGQATLAYDIRTLIDGAILYFLILIEDVCEKMVSIITHHVFFSF